MEHLETFMNVAYDIRSNWHGDNTTSLEMIELVVTNDALLNAVATRTNMSVEYINNTLRSVLDSVPYIAQLYELYNSSKSQGNFNINVTESFLPCSSATTDGMIVASIMPALVIIFIFSMVTKRVWNRKCCGGRPGLAMPVNLLDSYEDRFSYAFAFGATSSRIVLVILESDYGGIFGKELAADVAQQESYVQAIIKIIAAFIIGISYYPFFVCISTTRRLLGAIIGVIYSVFWFVAYLLELIECASDPSDQITIAENILMQIPPLVCHGFLTFCFLWVLVRSLISKRRGWVITKNEWKENYKYHYVKKLVKTIPKSEQKVIVVDGFKRKVVSNLYKWRADFKYSTRMVCIYATACICLYLVTIIFFRLGRGLTSLIQTIVDNFEERSVNKAEEEEFWDRTREGVQVGLVCWMVSIGVTVLKDIVMMANMLSWYRGHSVRLQRGDRRFLPEDINDKKPGDIMVASFKFAGYQVAYILWGFVITHFVLFLATSVLAFGFIWPLTWGELQDSIGLSLVFTFAPTFAISILTIIIQMLLAKYVFLRDLGATLALNNRRLYHIASYFLFFLNIFVGIFSCLVRIFYAILFGVLFLPRLQKSALPRDWELFDPGYKTYLGYLCLEHTHTNPILFTFSRLILEDIDTDAPKTRTNRKARNRWLLAMTLINNPELTCLRRQEKPKSISSALFNTGMTSITVLSAKADEPEVGEETKM